MPSFDVVSELNWAEVANALNQAQKELSQRFDFRGQDASAEKTDEGIVIRAATDDRVKAALEVVNEKLIRRKVALSYFDPGKPETGPKGTFKLVVKVKEGIDRDKAREIVQLVKDSKLKVQAGIDENSVRVTGQKKDELQSAIAALRAAELGMELQ